MHFIRPASPPIGNPKLNTNSDIIRKLCLGKLECYIRLQRVYLYLLLCVKESFTFRKIMQVIYHFDCRILRKGLKNGESYNVWNLLTKKKILKMNWNPRPFLHSVILTEYVSIEPRACLCMYVRVYVCVYVCVISTAPTDKPFMMKLSKMIFASDL